MITEKLAFEESRESHSLDRETQTNLADASPSLPRKEGIKECVSTQSQTNNVRESTSSCQLIKTVLSQKYSYCKEFICPYLNSVSKNFSINGESKDKVNDLPTKDDSVRVQSCIAISTKETMSMRDQNDNCKKKTESVCIAPSSNEKLDCPDPPLDKNSSCCCCNDNPPSKERVKCPPRTTECEKKTNVCDKTMKEANECKLKVCVTKCVKDTVKKIKRDQSHCETVIGIIPSTNPGDKNIFYPFNRLKERGSVVCEQKKSSVQELLEKKSESLSDMKTTVGNLLCKVYNKTREVIGMPATSSCGYQETHAQESESNEKANCGRSKRRKCSVTKCLYENDETELADNIHNLSNHSVNKFQHPVEMVYDKICSTVKTSFSSFSERSYMENLVDIVTFPKPDKSSPYDVPTTPPTPPQIAHLPPPTPAKQESRHNEVTPVHSGLMTSVKNKIRSIFGRNKASSTSLPAEETDKEDN